jgi:hypothetical protein
LQRLLKLFSVNAACPVFFSGANSVVKITTFCQCLAPVLARRFTAEHTEYAENINAFLCGLSELGGKNNQLLATKLNRGTI